MNRTETDVDAGTASATGRTGRWRRSTALVAAAALVLGACSGSDSPGEDAAGADAEREVDLGFALDSAPVTDATVLPGTQEVAVTGVEPGAPVTLLDAQDTPLITLLADDAGQVHTSYVPDDHLVHQTGEDTIIPTAAGQSLKPGTYRVAVGEGDDAAVSEPFEVTGIDDHPDEAHYDGQVLTGVTVSVLGEPVEGEDLEEGLNYLEMRDGTLLSAMVRFPDPAIHGEGPYPTVVEYSGYDKISDPGAQEPGSRIAQALGYATVGVSMRGTGCSGGAFDVFSASQQADGYDVIEIVGRQPWVKHNAVGMVGLSYSGITQLYTAATQPPHLAAVTPQSVIVDPWLQQWPGGVYNGGFTRQWLAQRDAQAEADGEGWVVERVGRDDPDETCAANLALRSQNVDFEAFGEALEMRPADAAERDLRELVRRIDVPVLLTGAFQDEQTGPLFTGIVDHFDAAPVLRARMWNGRHPDGYSPMNVEELFEFLELYVDREVPDMDPLLQLGLPIELGNEFQVEVDPFGPPRLREAHGDDYEAARAAYEAEEPVEVVFENGAGEDEPGEPGGTFSLRFATWPTDRSSTRTWYLGADGALAEEAPAGDDGADAFDHDPDAGGEDVFGEDGYELFTPVWDIDWTRFPDGTSLSYVTEPLAEDLVLGGPGEVTLWVGSEADDADVQVTLTEVTPDDEEVLLQSAYLRVGHRAVDDERSRPLRVEHPFTEEAYAPIPDGERVEARIALPSVAHALRAGSRLQLQVSAPGRNHGTWLFDSPYGDGEAPTHTVGRSAAQPSSIQLSVLPGVDVPPERPACGWLRGQPCRPFTPTANRTAED
jgi:predicted acyl esterase